jgi:hypothetical protein
MDTTLEEREELTMEEIEQIEREFEADLIRERLELKKRILEARKVFLNIVSLLQKNPSNQKLLDSRAKVTKIIKTNEKRLQELEQGFPAPEIPRVPYQTMERFVDYAGQEGIYNPSISRYFNFQLLLNNYNDINGTGTSLFKQFENNVNFQGKQAYAIGITLSHNGMYINVYDHSDCKTSLGHVSLHSGFNIVGLVEGSISHYKDNKGNVFPIGIIRKNKDIVAYFEGRPGTVFPPEGLFLIEKINELFKILVMKNFLRISDTANKYLSYKEKYLLYKRKYLNLKNKLINEQ